jgi:hypothetical protein
MPCLAYLVASEISLMIAAHLANHFWPRPIYVGCGEEGWGIGLATEFRSEKIPQNRLRMASVILRKKVLIPRHSEVYGRVNSKARTEENGMTKILLQQKE